VENLLNPTDVAGTSAAGASGAAPPGRSQRIPLYATRAAEHRRQAERLGARSRRIANLRGLCFGVSVVSGLTALGSESVILPLSLAGLSLCAFVVLVVRHSRVIADEDLAWRRYRVNDNARKRTSDDFVDLPEDGQIFQEADHPFSGDLDVFGRRSLFQCLNVAHTAYGQSALARALTAVDDGARVVERQVAVRELSGQLELRQALETYTLENADPPGEPRRRVRPPLDLHALIDWAESDPTLSMRPVLVWSARLLPPLTLLGALLWELAGLSAVVWALPLTLQLVVAGRAGPDAARVFAAVSSSPGAFARLRPTLRLLEGQQSQSPLLVRLRDTFRRGERTASQQMSRFERTLGWFELRHNGMVYPFVNALLLWDVHCTVAFEKWQADSGSSIRRWLEAIGEWEALSSLAGFAHDNPDFSFPKLVDEPSTFRVRGLGHPLIPPATRVTNDVLLEGPGTALLITGSNMSGKSTLLRAMGLAAVLGMSGTAVCASEMTFSTLSVYTSMRISDSLSAGVSHFYAELSKLRAVLRATEGSPPVLFLLDEILHGTNSEERQVGARWIRCHHTSSAYGMPSKTNSIST
jgi:hypothetical protein